VKDGDVWNATGITSGIDLTASLARVCFDKDVGWGGERDRGGVSEAR